jgi:serine phosphatase RsbU (regulator of sigma subunit)
MSPTTSTASERVRRDERPAREIPAAALRRVGGFVLFVLPGLWIATVLAVALLLPAGIELMPAVMVAPAIACAGTGRRRCVVGSGLVAIAALTAVSLTGHGSSPHQVPLVGTAVTIVAVIAVCLWLAERRARLTAELARTREIATATQQVLLPPLPPRLGEVTVAGEYLAAAGGARVGGDLYEVLATPYGLRAVLGDVRGHGLGALGTVSALLGSFREAAYDEAELPAVLARMARTLDRHLRQRERADAEEEFVTLLMLQLEDDGALSVLNCGHPHPYRIHGERAAPVDDVDPLPPLGLFDPVEGLADVAVHRTALAPGEALFLHTDGVPDARDPAGGFFPLPEALDEVVGAGRRDGPLCAEYLVAGMRAAVLRHTRGRVTDDMALLVLHRDAARRAVDHAHPW